jgi:hypothetical protein
MEADEAAIADSVLAHFNEYMQSSEQQDGAKPRQPRPISFVTEHEGYFRLEYSERQGASSAAIENFGTFLISSGYSISGISATKTANGTEGTEVKFSRENGKEERVVLSTLNVY